MKNLKKVIFWVVIIGAVGGGIFTYYIYQTIFAANTAFNNEEAHIYIESTAGFEDVKAELEPLLKNLDNFETVARKKEYINNIKAGHYVITKGMSNNDIVNTLRVNNIPITIRFNNSTPTHLEIKSTKKVAAQSRIMDHIKKKDYSTIVIQTVDGNVVNFENTRKYKL